MAATAKTNSGKAKPAAARKRGRPSAYSPALAREICWLVAEGMTIVEIAAREGMPAERTIYQWLSGNKDFAQDYTLAGERQVERHQQEIIRLEREVLNGELDPKAFHEVVLQRNWRAERMARKKYGRTLDVSGSLALTVADIARELEGDE